MVPPAVKAATFYRYNAEEWITPSATLIASGLVQLVGAASFFFAGRAVHVETRRITSASAANAFVVWWSAIGAYLALEGAFTALAAFGFVELVPWLAARYLGLFLIGAGLWGLTYYVAYVWTGRAGLLVPLAILFAALPAALVALQVTHKPLAVEPETWLVAFRFLEPIEGPVYAAILAGFALPPLLAAAGYLSLWRRTRVRAQRYRLALVATSILLYIGTGLAVRLGTSDLLKFVNLAIVGLGMSFTVVMAFRPPARVRRWLEAGAPAVDATLARRRRQEAIAQRCRDLV